MRRLALIPMLAVLAACPGDKKPPQQPTVQLDTAPAKLDTLATAIPTAEKDPPPLPKPIRRAQDADIPSAPAPLQEAVEREQSFSKFCYQEFGQKTDPRLSGGVAMVVSVGAGGITDAHVANDRWSSGAGKGVNSCLNEKAKIAWKLAPGAVKPGKYVVQLNFRGS
ncbi:MAG: hypothetical protein M3068_14415 [Gemmatimonadota bacterium]|nr:hypothetical protein [Gemmatimonadota bacterium]